MAYMEGFTVAVSGKYAYFGGGSPGLFIIDVSDPAQPKDVMRILTGPPYDIGTTGNLVCVAAWDTHLYDVSDMANIREVGLFLGNPGSLAVSQKYCYVADSAGLHAARLQAENYGRSEVGRFATENQKVKIVGKFAYLFSAAWGLRILEIFEDGRIGTRKTDTGADFFWPGSTSGLRLQRAPSLDPGAVWEESATAPVQVGNEWRSPASEGFFRLVPPP